MIYPRKHSLALTQFVSTLFAPHTDAQMAHSLTIVNADRASFDPEFILRRNFQTRKSSKHVTDLESRTDRTHYDERALDPTMREVLLPAIKTYCVAFLTEKQARRPQIRWRHGVGRPLVSNRASCRERISR